MQDKAKKRARPRTLKVAALNFSIETKQLHNSASYLDLFNMLAKLNIAVIYHGESRLLLSVTWEDENDNKRLIGTLDRFTDIDAFNWYNRTAGRPATKEERNAITVPENMRANYRGVEIVFDSRTHRMVFPTYHDTWSISPRQVLKAFQVLLNDSRVRERFGSVMVSIEQEPAALDSILDSKSLRYLRIVVFKPNSSFGRFDQSFEDQMEAMRAKRIEHQVDADARESLLPSPELRNAAASALNNGSVEAGIWEDGSIKHISTNDFPIVESVTYQPRFETVTSALKRAATKLLLKIAERVKNQEIEE